jgi:uncharacterized RDD family membrane protein YckC
MNEKKPTEVSSSDDSATAVNLGAHRPASNWLRFFARQCDLWWQAILFGALIGVVIDVYLPSFLKYHRFISSRLIMGMAAVPFCLLLDAAVFRIFGNTPGKSLLGLKVINRDGSSLSFGRYLGRNFRMWFSGLGLAIPIVNFFTMAYQSRRLSDERPASYDEATGHQVCAKPVTWMRQTVFALCFVGIVAVPVALNVLILLPPTQSSVDYLWTNPITSRATRIAGKWKHSTLKNQDGLVVHQFVNQRERAVLLLGVEDADVALMTYIGELLKANEKTMRFSSFGTFSKAYEHPTWRIEGALISKPGVRLQLDVMQLDQSFWRTIVLQYEPYTGSDASVAQLRHQLWYTVQ